MKKENIFSKLMADERNNQSTKNHEVKLDLANLTNPVKHQADDTGAWRKKWSDDRKPQALAVGAQGAAEAKLTVKHDIKDQNEFEIFKKHVSRMEEKGMRKEMGAQNMPV